MEMTLRAVKTDIDIKKSKASSAQLTPAMLVDSYSNTLYLFCCRLTYSKEDAEDLFQETFLKVFEQPSKVNKAENPKSFIFSTALYLWRSKKRKYARRNRLAPTQALDDQIVSDINIEDSIIRQEDVRQVRELVHQLPEKYKVPTILHYTAEMCLSDIAETLNLPVGTVKSRLHKARKLIEKGLSDNGK